MSEDKEALVEQLVEAVTEADGDIDNEALLDAHPVLFKRARMAFGSWEDALVAALVKTCQGSRRRRVSSRAVEVEASHERVCMDGWDGPVVFVGGDGTCFVINGDALPLSQGHPAPLTPFSPRGEAMTLENLISNPNEDVLVVVSERGLVYPLDGRVVPHVSATTRTPADMTGMASDEAVKVFFARREILSGDRFVHVTAGGRIKASRARDLGRVQDRDGTVAFLLAEGDAVVSAFAQSSDQATFFCASANGNGIHFKGKDVRTMGLRAQGVKAMELSGDFDAIVGAVPCVGDEQLLVISAAGDAKRVPLSQFRVQGRGGQGMILMRPHRSGDELAALAATRDLNEDVMVWTASGRSARLPVTRFPLLDRAAKGQAVVDVESGDRVVGLRVMPGQG